MKVASHLFIENFPEGAEKASQRRGINVIIDTFRASNTILALLKYVDKLIPVSEVDEALNSEADMIIGEVGGQRPTGFHLTNSPVEVERIGYKLKGKQVVIRTTNGTQGILKSKGAEEVLIASPRNAGVVSHYLVQKMNSGVSVTLVAMGTRVGSEYVNVPEDDYTAQLIADKILGVETSLETKQGLFEAIFEDEEYYERKVAAIGKDIDYCLSIDTSDIIPKFDFEQGAIANSNDDLRQKSAYQ